MNQQAPKKLIDLNHRLNGYETDKPDVIGLCDAIDAMTDRATASTQLLKVVFSSMDNGIPLNDDHFYHVLNSITLELADIQKTVAFYAAVNKPKNQA